MSRSDKQMHQDPNYYQSLIKAYEEAFEDFARIIELDVNRTPLAKTSEEIHKSLTNILLAYAKYNAVDADATQRLATVKD